MKDSYVHCVLFQMRTSQSVQSGVDGAKSDHSVWTASGHADCMQIDPSFISAVLSL